MKRKESEVTQKIGLVIDDYDEVKSRTVSDQESVQSMREITVEEITTPN